jgi:2-dehydro-3-deoxyphosphogluconate aldolase/(4S)-4-hydroxy-2-oxoglutarate aldolase
MTKAFPDMLVGAGTVLTNDQVDRAVAAGAKFIVSPGLNPETVKHCQEIGIPVCPGTSNPSDIEMALSLGLKTVKFFPAEAAGGLKYIKSIAAPYVDVTFMPTGGINEKNLLDYLSFKKIICCGGSWMVPGDALAAKDWDRIRSLVSSAVALMLGMEVVHVGINSADEAEAMDTATKLCKLFNWPIKVGNKSIFAGSGVEVMKMPFRGTHGHIGIQTNFIDRAKAYLERQGFVFDESSANIKDGKLTAIYLKDEIAGFALHLVQKK